VLALLPLWNRQRLRIGDLVAGTMVVQTPAGALLDEVGADADAVAFTPAQLDVYGVYELQVLEGLLRDYDAKRRPTTGSPRWPTRSRRRSSGRETTSTPIGSSALSTRRSGPASRRGFCYGKRKADKYARG